MNPQPDIGIGRSFFSKPWVQAPSSTTARDGLGPLFNAHACTSCHPGAGRGKIDPAAQVAPTALIVRLSLPGQDAIAGVVPDPVYGDQIQPLGVRAGKKLQADGKTGEAVVEIDYETTRGEFDDGETYELRRPKPRVTNPRYGPVHADARLSLRLAPGLHGAGVLDAVPEAAIVALADPDDRDGDGISGRPNRVWDQAQGRAALGRFGWKASQPTLEQQVAIAFRNDIGITNERFREQPCTPTQEDCLAMPNGADPELGVEIPPRLFNAVVGMTRDLPSPKSKQADDPQVAEGGALFASAGCAACHRPILEHGAAGEVHPYTDLLLHDMGPGLADGREDFEASGQEWRTAPLWGIARGKPENRAYLHDGRARTIVEAILWHGGEADAARAKFISLSRRDRDALVKFIESL